jgi:hypothetical protein
MRDGAPGAWRAMPKRISRLPDDERDQEFAVGALFASLHNLMYKSERH